MNVRINGLADRRIDFTSFVLLRFALFGGWTEGQIGSYKNLVSYDTGLVIKTTAGPWR